MNMAENECGCKKEHSDVIVCRCEEITKAEIEKLIQAGFVDIDAIKRATRAGMGMCQSKSCTPIITRMIAQMTGIPMSELKPFTNRAPMSPIKASALISD